MIDRPNTGSADAVAQGGNPYSGSSLVPMLVAGIVLTLVGMIAAVLELNDRGRSHESWQSAIPVFAASAARSRSPIYCSSARSRVRAPARRQRPGRAVRRHRAREQQRDAGNRPGRISARSRVTNSLGIDCRLASQPTMRCRRSETGRSRAAAPRADRAAAPAARRETQQHGHAPLTTVSASKARRRNREGWIMVFLRRCKVDGCEDVPVRSGNSITSDVMERVKFAC